MADLDFFSATMQIGTITHLDIAGMELVYRVEISGDAFYQKLADAIGNEEVAALLRSNGREETGHARRIRRAIDIKAGPTYAAPANLDGPFEIALPPNIDASLFEIIVQAELSGDVGYQGWADNEPDAEIKRLLLLNGAEETVHSERMQKAIAILQASQPG